MRRRSLMDSSQRRTFITSKIYYHNPRYSEDDLEKILTRQKHIIDALKVKKYILLIRNTESRNTWLIGKLIYFQSVIFTI